MGSVCGTEANEERLRFNGRQIEALSPDGSIARTFSENTARSAGSYRSLCGLPWLWFFALFVLISLSIAFFLALASFSRTFSIRVEFSRCVLRNMSATP